MKFLLLFWILLFSACAGVTGTGNPCVGTDCLEPTGQGIPSYSNTDFNISFTLYSWSANELGVSSESALSGSGAEQVLTVELTDGSTSVMTVGARKLNSSHVLSSLLTQLYPGVQQNSFSGTSLQGYWLLDPGTSKRIYFFLAQQTLVSMQVHVQDADGVYESVISSLEIE